ncbi:hypothetical protein [Bradyrhizobium sp. USDA 4473]
MLGGLNHYLEIKRWHRFRDKLVRDYKVKAKGTLNRDEVQNLRQQHLEELHFHDEEFQLLISDYLVAQAREYLVSLPSEDGCWDESAAFGKKYLNRKGAAKVRNDIRAEKKAMWDYWAARVTLALGLIGSIFGVLAYFKK